MERQENRSLPSGEIIKAYKSYKKFLEQQEIEYFDPGDKDNDGLLAYEFHTEEELDMFILFYGDLFKKVVI
jgi:hypothetical protein